jgi:hypothetical protein
MRCAPLASVSLDPMLEQMLVAGEQQAHVVLVEQGHPLRANRAACRSSVAPPCGSGRKRRMVKEDSDVGVATPVDPASYDRIHASCVESSECPSRRR